MVGSVKYSLPGDLLEKSQVLVYYSVHLYVPNNFNILVHASMFELR